MFAVLFGLYFLAAAGGFTVLFGWLTHSIFTNHMNHGMQTTVEWLWGCLAGLTGIFMCLFGLGTIVLAVGYVAIVIARVTTKNDDPFARD